MGSEVHQALRVRQEFHLRPYSPTLHHLPGVRLFREGFSEIHDERREHHGPRPGHLRQGWSGVVGALVLAAARRWEAWVARAGHVAGPTLVRLREAILT